jgi:hypothetical protein
MEITFKQGDITHRGTVTTFEKDNEFQYFFNLGESLQFTIRLSDDGYWESDNPDIDPQIVMYAGDAIENMEDLADVLTELDSLRN